VTSQGSTRAAAPSPGGPTHGTMQKKPSSGYKVGDVLPPVAPPPVRAYDWDSWEYRVNERLAEDEEEPADDE
jgi:hypothetical protein